MIIKKAIEDKRALSLSLLISLLYYTFYLYSIGTIVFNKTSFSTYILPNWKSLIFKQRAPLLWEPIGVLYLGFGEVYISINLLLGVLLALLLFFNLLLALYSLRLPKVCRVGSKGILAILPSFLSGFACCVPTFLIALGPILGSFSVYLVKLQLYVIPLSILLLSLSLVATIKKLRVFIKK